MSTQRFTPEFKAEAVRQVIERGYPSCAGRKNFSCHFFAALILAFFQAAARKRSVFFAGVRLNTPKLSTISVGRSVDNCSEATDYGGCNVLFIN